MSATSPPLTLDLQEQIARIDRALAENRKFQAETDKLFAESRKLASEDRKLVKDSRFVGFQVAFAGFTTGAVVIGAIVALMKVLH